MPLKFAALSGLGSGRDLRIPPVGGANGLVCAKWVGKSDPG
jgi:hypothetical protein